MKKHSTKHTHQRKGRKKMAGKQKPHSEGLGHLEWGNQEYKEKTSALGKVTFSMFWR